jgi:hypothetical protein
VSLVPSEKPLYLSYAQALDRASSPFGSPNNTKVSMAGSFRQFHKKFDVYSLLSSFKSCHCRKLKKETFIHKSLVLGTLCKHNRSTGGRVSGN